MPEKKKRWIMFFKVIKIAASEKNPAILIAPAVLIAPSKPYLADSLGQNQIISQNIFPITSPKEWLVTRGTSSLYESFIIISESYSC